MGEARRPGKAEGFPFAANNPATDADPSGLCGSDNGVSWCAGGGSGPAQSPGGNPGSPALNPPTNPQATNNGGSPSASTDNSHPVLSWLIKTVFEDAQAIWQIHEHGIQLPKCTPANQLACMTNPLLGALIAGDDGGEDPMIGNGVLDNEYRNFYGGNDGGVIATLNPEDGNLSLAIEKGVGTPRGGQMFADAINHFGINNINGIEGKWVPAMPTNLNAFNENILGGMTPEEAASNTFTGTMAARYGFTDVQILNLVGEPGAYTNVQVLFTR